MDNHDGTLSIFGTLLDHAAAAATLRRPARPPASTPTSSPRSAASSPTTTRRPATARGEGAANDQNVELLVFDPRKAGSPDADGDGIPNAQDNCPGVANPDQSVNPCRPPSAAGGPGNAIPSVPARKARCKKAKKKRRGASAAKKKRKRCKARKKKR